MLTLCGFSASNYYNKVKLALLEKGLPFTEELAWVGETDRSASPLGKVPYLRTPQGALCESAVIADYIEAAHPDHPLIPADPYQAAKVRELITYCDLHVELCARQLYAQAFFGGTLSEKFVARVKKDLARNLVAFRELATFAPYAAGETFTMADCAVYTSLPLAALASKLVCGEDLVAAAGIDWKSYVKLVEQRPTAQKVAADRKADQLKRMG